jgi:ureidoacrylate peracid hydrolase
MHKINILPETVERVMKRRGRLHVYDDLDPGKTALIVIDMQNGFLVEDVAVSYVPMALEIIPQVNRLAEAVRRTGGKVFWIQNTVDAASLETWSTWFAAMRSTDAHRANMAPGSRGHELHPDLKVLPEDEIVRKYRFSAFLQGASDLPARLEAGGFDTVLITGTVTNVCCESTARDAMMLNYKVIMVSDANAARNDAEHNATLNIVYSTFGDVMDTDTLIACLDTRAAPAITAA